MHPYRDIAFCRLPKANSNTESKKRPRAGCSPKAPAFGGSLPRAEGPGGQTTKTDVAVGMQVASHPPHRSVQARLTHTALTLDG